MINEKEMVYLERIALFKVKQEKNKRYVNLISGFRLLFFVGSVWFFILSVRYGFEGVDLWYSLFLMICFFIGFFISGVLRSKNEFLRQLILINENEINPLNSKLSFLDEGSYHAGSEGFMADLNIFGSHSLFQLLNRTGSNFGKYKLTEKLSFPSLDPKIIRQYQDCTRSLSDKISFRQSLLARTLLLSKGNTLFQSDNYFEENKLQTIESPIWKFISIIWPILAICVITYSIVIGNSSLPLIFMILGLFIKSLISKKTNILYSEISKQSDECSTYSTCFLLIRKETFEDQFLLALQKDILLASAELRKLSQLARIFDLRLSPLGIVANGFFLLDLQCSGIYLKWLKRNQSNIKIWFNALGEFECINSLATFYYNHPQYIFPEIDADNLFIKATGMGHPLMRSGKMIVNDYEIGLDAKIQLITGSNMSGKSTFLRSLGINMILAQIGAPVYASSFIFKPVRLFTSFHHLDSLDEGTSYFYAEVKCLQRIILALSERSPSLILLDEVLRGTNSVDKHEGTALLIKKLSELNCLVMIATHDTELGLLANDQSGIENFCFESSLIDDELIFDYKMHKGVSQSRNATFLMKKMGII